MKIYILDNSNHKLAGQWVSDCIPGRGDKCIVGRDSTVDLLSNDNISHLLITGSEHSVFEDEFWILKQLDLIRECAGNGIPVLGICFGHQLIVRAFYGKEALKRRPKPEVGWRKVVLTAHPVFGGLPATVRPYLFHFDEALTDKIPDFEVIAYSELCPCQAIVHRSLPVVGVQFHPETTPDEGSKGYRRERALLEAFGFDVKEVLISLPDGDACYYPQIIRNFVEVYG